MVSSDQFCSVQIKLCSTRLTHCSSFKNIKQNNVLYLMVLTALQNMMGRPQAMVHQFTKFIFKISNTALIFEILKSYEISIPPL